MKRLLILTAALVAAVAVLIVVSLPPIRLTLNTPFADGTVPGIVHVHTNRSDGRGTPDEIAAAARRAGVRFIVFTDHGDATRTPDPPVYRSGVLCLDAVEISTNGGHYLALDMTAAPYPLAGDARDVVEDVRRLGGFGIVAHPNSPKLALSWRDWDAPFDGLEWINPDTSWRVQAGKSGWRSRVSLAEALLAYPFRSPETIARLLGETTVGVDRWESLTRSRQVVAVAGVDAHAKLAFGNVDPGDNRFSLPVPGYEAAFRTLSIRVRPERGLAGDAVTDAAAVMRAIRLGHLYTAIDGLASPPSFEFTATNPRGTVGEGDTLSAGGPVTLHVRSNAPRLFTTVLWQGDRRLATVHDQADYSRSAPDVPAVYRVEIDAPSKGGPIPWIVSNPIYVGGARPSVAPPARRAVSNTHPLFDGRTSMWWRVEADSTSLAALDVVPLTSGTELRLRYGLSGGSPSGQSAVLAVELPNGAAPNDRVTFTMRGEHPLRLSVQFRTRGTNERWQRSVWFDEINRERTVYFDDATPVGATRSPRPVPADIHDILFVVDTTNTKPGASGRLWLKSAALER